MSFNLTDDDLKTIVAEKDRSKYSAKQFWEKKCEKVLNDIEAIDINSVTEKELLKDILIFAAKTYWEQRKP